jgi:hypothetical protein
MELPLNTDEAQLLHRILTTTLSNLRMEISNTDSYDFRQALKQDEVMIRDLIARLEQATQLRSKTTPSTS